MDVQSAPSGWEQPDGINESPLPLPSRAGALSDEHVGRALGEWQAGELRVARGLPHCRGLGREQLEDLYQETALVLLHRSFDTEEHLRHALRWGIKQRALRLHRDERRRREILSQRGPEMQLAAESREGKGTPELAAVLEDDRLIVAEFLAELSDLERRVFWLMAEGMRYRAIAPVLQIPVNEARKAARTCERKRESFQLLYDTGRLCGFRFQTIAAMQAGEAVAEDLAHGAYAHLEGCASCRAEHRTNARRLRRSFQGQAAALLPIPVLADRMGWLARLDIRARAVQQRLAEYGQASGGGAVRERAVAMVAGGGAATKLAAGVATVAVIAGGAIGATRAIDRPQYHPHQHVAASATAPAPAVSTAPVARAPASREQPARPAEAAQQPSAARHEAQGHPAGASREPGGFAYLGVPSTATPAANASTASTASTGAHTRTGGGEEQRGGGPFTP